MFDNKLVVALVGLIVGSATTYLGLTAKWPEDPINPEGIYRRVLKIGCLLSGIGGLVGSLVLMLTKD